MMQFGPPPISLTPRQAALRAVAFRLLLESETPVPPQRLACELDTDVATVVSDLDLIDRGGRIKRTAASHVVASLGLTLVPTCHRISVAGVERHTWCALDALGICGALASDGWIQSKNPATGHHIRFDVRDGLTVGHPSPYVLFLAEQASVDSVIDEWCPLVNFFPDAASARAWAVKTGAAGRTFDVTEASRLARELWQPLIEAAPGPVPAVPEPPRRVRR